ncbi:hypothetical protein ACMGER_13545 [Sphingomonas sp. DT-204]
MIGLAVLAWQAVTFSLAIAARKGDPAWAAKLAPNNALVLAALARSELAGNPAAAANAARRALLRDATNASAAGVLGMAVAQAGDDRHAVALLAYSQVMSRRDLPTQLWAIEAAVQRGDINKALHHYDIALRVGSSMPTVLFPVLVSATDDPNIRVPLARMLRSGVPWGSSFLDYLSANTTNLVSASQLVTDLYAAGGRVPRNPGNLLIQRLTDANDVERAWFLYARANPGARRLGMRNGGFEAAVEAPTVFDWQLEDRGDARAEILPGERGGELHVEARSGSGGRVARQRLMLSPATYTLAFKARADEGATLGDSVIELFCMPSRQRIAQTRLVTAPGRERSGVQFAVPRDCPSQSLEVTLYAGAAETTIDGILDDVDVRAMPPNGSSH